ncbi:hypothetical protein MIND_01378500 [Mycena indigotica]|uniref:Uncharacterized protein n=1 Tax=Mycena indigotica TaxID=2126181 RepID=A0A8H6RXL1_9AGAR|nr:uncharacterized protein MIND_01378500 [Mycena indigotica]KAF7289174.1 hypothetical protein MIND_01378500 [Mycena indigotica]
MPHLQVSIFPSHSRLPLSSEMWRLPLLLLRLGFPLITAALTNITIDDGNLDYFSWFEDPAISPAPLHPWAASSPGNRCDYCSAQPPATDIFNQTWHDGSNNSAGSLTFQGSAVYIYGIDLANPANVSFSFDGQPAGFHLYTGAEGFVFKSLFFSRSGLSSSGNHTVEWVLRTSKTNGTTALFDYAMITVDAATSSSNTPPGSTSSPSSKKSSNTGAIAGGVIGGLVGPDYREKPRSRNERTTSRHIEPFNNHAEPAESVATSSPQESKTYDVAWATPALSAPSLPATTAAIDVASASIQATDSASTVTTTTRERQLEARLAALEAQVLQAEPPPYIPSSREEADR